MDKEILKLFPQKAFKLLSIKDSLRIGSEVTKSLIDKKSYEKNLSIKKAKWKWDEIKIRKDEIISKKSTGKKLNIVESRNILKIYFSQFYETESAVNLDLRINHFENVIDFQWKPSSLHFRFSNDFMEGVQFLYQGFYLNKPLEFEHGLKKLGILKENVSEVQKNNLMNLFYEHFGGGKDGPISFTLKKLQNGFNHIFAYFLKEDIPLNPEFAVLGVNLVTLYLTLQESSDAIDVKEVFKEVYLKYRN
jgi:hypothetical protein